MEVVLVGCRHVSGSSVREPTIPRIMGEDPALRPCLGRRKNAPIMRCAPATSARPTISIVKRLQPFHSQCPPRRSGASDLKVRNRLALASRAVDRRWPGPLERRAHPQSRSPGPARNRPHRSRRPCSETLRKNLPDAEQAARRGHHRVRRTGTLHDLRFSAGCCARTRWAMDGARRPPRSSQ